MGNLLKGVSSESANVDAKWPERKSVAEAQSLKPSPAFRSGIRSFGIANAPSATTGASFNNSRRLMLLNLRLSIRELINGVPEESDMTQMRFAEWQKVAGCRPDAAIVQLGIAAPLSARAGETQTRFSGR